jgi:hypothetical protein
MSKFGENENGAYKELSDGRVLYAREQIYNSIITLSESLRDPCWSNAW